MGWASRCCQLVRTGVVVRVPLQLGDLTLKLGVAAAQVAEYDEQDDRHARHRAKDIGRSRMAGRCLPSSTSLPSPQQKCRGTM